MASIEEAREILKELGMPPAQHNQMAGMTLLALCQLRRDVPWNSAKRKPCTITKGIMNYLKEHYDADYAPNTRETFRRQVLHQFVQAGIAEHNPMNPNLPTNSPLAHYAISCPALEVVQAFGSSNWPEKKRNFMQNQNSLVSQLMNKRMSSRVAVRLPAGKTAHLSPGKHSQIHKAIIEFFLPMFAPQALVLYLGDTAKKNQHINQKMLDKLGVRLRAHDKLPDVILYDEEKDLLFLIEAVSSHGPMSDKRIRDFNDLLEKCSAKFVYVSAFNDFATFCKYAATIAWGTKVWICANPDHLIHFNGDSFS